MSKPKYHKLDHDLVRQLHTGLSDLAILAGACAEGCLAHQSVDPMEELRRELRSQSIRVEFCIAALLDRLECSERAVRKQSDLVAKTQQSAAASIVAASIGESFDPRGCFVYILWGDDPERPVYVGKSTNVLSRLGSHMQPSSAKGGLVRRVQLMRCRDRPTMDRTEVRLIHQYRPLLNVALLPHDHTNPNAAQSRAVSAAMADFDRLADVGLAEADDRAGAGEHAQHHDELVAG
ncbi:MAG: hypothetical protein ACRDUX_35735 [Mycobacterium sp.]